jgi:hypothetical protein
MRDRAQLGLEIMEALTAEIIVEGSFLVLIVIIPLRRRSLKMILQLSNPI